MEKMVLAHCALSERPVPSQFPYPTERKSELSTPIGAMRSTSKRDGHCTQVRRPRLDPERFASRNKPARPQSPKVTECDTRAIAGASRTHRGNGASAAKL